MSRWLSVTFRDGRLIAAYLYLRREPNDSVARTTPTADGMLVDYDSAAKPLGIEFTAPSHITLNSVNSLLQSLAEAPATVEELSPLLRSSNADAAA